MAKYYNRGGIAWQFDPADPKVIARVANGELRLAEEVDVPREAEEAPEMRSKDEIASGSFPPSNFDGSLRDDPRKAGSESQEDMEDEVDLQNTKVAEPEGADVPIETLRADYEAKFGKKVSARYKNNVEWILSKLA